VSALELPGEEISQPTFEKRSNAAHEEQPDAPTWSPESAPGAFSDRSLKKIRKHWLLKQWKYRCWQSKYELEW
jgi:hypothetical protein